MSDNRPCSECGKPIGNPYWGFDERVIEDGFLKLRTVITCDECGQKIMREGKDKP